MSSMQRAIDEIRAIEEADAREYRDERARRKEKEKILSSPFCFPILVFYQEYNIYQVYTRPENVERPDELKIIQKRVGIN